MTTPKDRFRRERRRLRADWDLIKRGASRETRRRIWRLVRVRHAQLARPTCLSRAVLYVAPELWDQIFPGRKRGWTSADARRARKTAHRRAQRERMARHQAKARGAAIAAWGAAFEARGRTATEGR